MVAISAAHTDKRVTTCAVTKGLSAAAMGKTVEGAAVMLVGPVAMLALMTTMTLVSMVRRTLMALMIGVTRVDGALTGHTMETRTKGRMVSGMLHTVARVQAAAVAINIITNIINTINTINNINNINNITKTTTLGSSTATAVASAAVTASSRQHQRSVHHLPQQRRVQVPSATALGRRVHRMRGGMHRHSACAAAGRVCTRGFLLSRVLVQRSAHRHNSNKNINRSRSSKKGVG